MNVIWYALWYIVAVGFLVIVHEFGHFWVARRLGFKVLRFSVGFGTPLLRKAVGADRTEIVTASSPAARAGLRNGDEITAIDGAAVTDQRDVLFDLLDSVLSHGRASLTV